MSQRQQNFHLTRQSSSLDLHPFSSRRYRNAIAVTSVLAFLGVLTLYHHGGDERNNKDLLLRQYESSVEKESVFATNTIASNEKSALTTHDAKVRLNSPKATESNNDDDDETHPWSWIGFSEKLLLSKNQDSQFVTSTLKDYATNKTSYSSPAAFLRACNTKQLPDQRCGFLVGPEAKFSDMPPHVMKVLRHLGMDASSRVLEVGVGLGRNAQSLINFLEKDKYCGIEPNGDMLAVGVAHMIGRKVLDEKQPVFSTNSDFDFGVFFKEDDTKHESNHNQLLLFDVVTSRSVWSHTSKNQNEKYLASFAKYSKPTAFLATSVIQITEDCSRDYNGTEWVGKSHDANNEGIVIHCMPWIREACAKYGLIVRSLSEEAPELMKGFGPDKWNDLGQPWIVVRHDQSSVSNGE